MKKKLITIVIGAMLCAGLFAGCGQSDTKQDKAAGTESAKQADTKDEGEKGSQEEKELTGTIDDIKDFMFVVTDDKDTPYSFNFDEKPDGLEGVASGDKVTVKYTGTISEVDPFEGEVISVEKTNQNKNSNETVCYDCVCIYDAGGLHRNSAETKDTWCNIYGREQYDY